MLIDDLQDSSNAEYVLDQGPLWISWSSDSRYLLAHRDADHFLVDTQDGIQVNELDIQSEGYRAAAWKPLESAITVASKNGPGGSTIVTAEVAAESRLPMVFKRRSPGGHRIEPRRHLSRPAITALPRPHPASRRCHETNDRDP